MGELLANHTTLRLGGPAAHWLTHSDPDTWPDLVHAVRRHPGRAFPLGGGSNTLADDDGYDGTVVHMATRGITAHNLDDGLVEATAQAGEPLDDLVAWSVAEGLSGIEYLAGIPGTVGAAPVQNTGAYGQQISDCLTSVAAYDWRTHRTVRLPAAACGFGYRTSLFKKHPGRLTVLSITLRLRRSDTAVPISYRHLADRLSAPLGTRPPLREASAAVHADRAERGLTLPSGGPDARQAGSIFLNPPVTRDQAERIRTEGGPLHADHDGALRASAGWLLERQGHHPGDRLGPGVRCSTRRALTLTASRGATASVFVSVVRQLAGEVTAVTGIQLVPEPSWLGACSAWAS